MVQSEAVMPPSTRKMVCPLPPIAFHRLEKVVGLVANSFQRIGALAIKLVGNRGEQSVAGDNRLAAG